MSTIYDRAKVIRVAGLALWLGAVAPVVAIAMLKLALGDLGCESPIGSSRYGHASWQWWYPGTRCSYTGGGTEPAHVDRPPLSNGVLAIVLVGWPLVIVAATRRTRTPASHGAIRSR